MAVEQTKAVFEPLKQRIAEAVMKLQEQIVVGQEEGAPEGEIDQAKVVLSQAQAVNGA
jgi:tubulin-specific chaperone A